MSDTDFISIDVCMKLFVINLISKHYEKKTTKSRQFLQIGSETIYKHLENNVNVHCMLWSLITARNEGYIFTGVCDSVQGGRCSRRVPAPGGSAPVGSARGPAPGGGLLLWGWSAPGGVPAPGGSPGLHIRGNLRGSGPGPHPREKLRGIRSRPTPQGEIEGDQVQAHT